MATHHSRLLSGAVAALLLLGALAFAESDADKEKKRQEIMEKMEKLRAQKDKIKQKEKENIDKIDTKSKANRGESIRLFEQIVATTVKGDARRCDALFQLGALYYDDERERYIELQSRFSNQYSAWEKSGGAGAPPVEPIPDYPKSIGVYKELILACPGSKNRDVALYKLGNIFTAVGNFEMAYESFKTLIEEFPKSENAPFAHLRIGEYYYMMRDNDNAVKHYKEVGMSSGADNYLLSLYRIASCYYNQSQFEKAIDNFFQYVELADSGNYKRADFREEALEYLAISFSEMEDGAEKALEYFNKKGGRSYQDFVIYTIGIKNRDHDNVKESIKSLNFLLKNYPNYVEAPMALKALTDCYVIEKDYGQANALREQLIRDYGPGSTWDKTYSTSTEKVKAVRDNIRSAAAMIPLYYHRMAVAQRDSGHTEKARELYKKSIEWYGGYIQKFPNDKWNNYTFHYFRADLLSDTLIGRYDEAAKEFEWVSREDTTRYPSRVVDRAKLEEEEKKQERSIKDQFKSDIKEQVATVQVSPEEAGYAAIVCIGKITEKALSSHGLTDTTAYQGLSLPEMQRYLSSIRSFRDRFPTSQHSADVAFLESNIYFNAKDYAKAIEGYTFILTNFPDNDRITKETLENLARAYMNIKEFDKAIVIFKRLDHEYSPTPADKERIMESVAATLFLIADNKLKAGDYTGAADFYRQVVIDYPTFARCDRALFNAAYAYEQGKMYTEAAREYERVFDRFPKFDKRRDAIFRAAHCFQLAREFGLAAEIFLKYTKELPADSEAVPCVFRAAAMYDSAGNTLLSAKTFEKVFDLSEEAKRSKGLYPKAQEEAPGALYSAGLIYEKGRKFEDAINIYRKLETLYPASPFTPEAVYSIAICYEKMENDRKMAEAYLNFIQKYGTEKGKVVESLMKSARAYKRLGQKADEEKMYFSIIEIQNKYGKDDQFSIDPSFAAECYFTLGQREYDRFAELDLKTSKTGKAGTAEIGEKLKVKVQALSKPVDYFAKCIALGTDKWTTRAVFMCGEIFWNLLERIKDQPILEKDPAKIAYAKVKVNEMLPEYYNKAMEYYYTNVAKFGNEMGFHDEWVEQSSEKYAQCWYQLGFNNVENGNIFSAAPNPFPKGTQEYDEYQKQIQGVVEKLIAKCVPLFENGIRACAEIYINNSWVERMKAELAIHSPGNEALKVTAKEAPKTVVRSESSSSGFADDAYERAMKRISNVVADEGMAVSEKTAVLQSIEAGARREIERLKAEIDALKAK